MLILMLLWLYTTIIFINHCTTSEEVWLRITYWFLMFCHLLQLHNFTLWFFQVCEVYRLHRETLYLAIDFIDRYLCVTHAVRKQQLQLLGITALFLAAKLEVSSCSFVRVYWGRGVPLSNLCMGYFCWPFKKYETF